MTKAELQELWETRIAEYRASGQSVKEWCTSHDDITPRQLWYWLRKYKTRKDAPSMKSTQWLPVEINEQSPVVQGNTLLIRIGQAGIEVSPGFDPALLAQIVRVLVTLC